MNIIHYMYGGIILLTILFCVSCYLINPVIIEHGTISNCSGSDIVGANNTIEVEKIVTQTILQNTTCPEYPISFCNTTQDCVSSQYTKEYVMSLIRQARRCDNRDLKWINNTECSDMLNVTQIKLDDCNSKFDNMSDKLDNLTYCCDIRNVSRCI